MISIVVPIYNAERYLEECVYSLMKQTYKNIEIILVDDGSTDNSWKLCCRLQDEDKRIRAFHKKNSGVSATRNYGIEKAKGELISFCDADDVVVENLYELLINHILSQDVDRVCGGYSYLYPNNRLVYNKPRVPDGLYEKDKLLSIMIDDGTLSGFQFSGVNNSIFKKKIIEQYNIRFRENIRYNEDSLFSFEYALYSKNLYSLRSIPLYYYRQHNNSATSKRFLDDKYSALHSYLNSLDFDKKSINYQLQMNRRVVTIALWDIFDITKHEKGYEAIKDIKKIIISDNVVQNMIYIDVKHLNKYKAIYYFLMKNKMATVLYLITKWVLPIMSKYLVR